MLGALLIPFIHLSVYLFAARLHPMPVVLKPSRAVAVAVRCS